MSSAGWQPSDVDLLLANLDRRLSSVGIAVISRPPANARVTVDETKFEEMLRKAIPTYSEEALKHDLDAVTAIHRLRRGRTPRDLESAHAVFVTTNRPLATVSAQFFLDEYGRGEYVGLPHCLLDRMFDALIWVKNPGSMPDLPKARILADSYAALLPPEHLWKRYLEEVERLRNQGDLSEEDVVALRYSLDARNALMDITLGDDEAFTVGTVNDVLERAHASLADEETKRRRAAEAEAGRLRAIQDAQLERVRVFARKSAHVLAVLVWLLAIAALGVGVFVSLALLGLPDFASPLGVILVVMIGIASVANFATGWNLRPLMRKFELGVAFRLEALAKRVIAVDGDPPGPAPQDSA